MHDLVKIVALTKLKQLLRCLIQVSTLRMLVCVRIHRFCPLVDLVHGFWLHRVVLFVIHQLRMVLWAFFGIRHACIVYAAAVRLVLVVRQLDLVQRTVFNPARKWLRLLV